MSDEYVNITLTLKNVAPSGNSAWFENPHGDEDINIPFSVMHVASEQSVRITFSGEELELRIREWKLKQEGLI